MERTDTKIIRFKHGDFFVDIVELDDMYEAWLRHKNYGISDMMFGDPKEYGDLNWFLDLVEANLDEYEEGYMEEYAD